MNNYIVYKVTHNNTLVYIGSGLPTRPQHVLSGTSHNYELNKLHFTSDIPAEVEILNCNLSKQESLDIEKKLIEELQPPFNCTHTVKLELGLNANKTYKYMDSLINDYLSSDINKLTKEEIKQYRLFKSRVVPQLKNHLKIIKQFIKEYKLFTVGKVTLKSKIIETGVYSVFKKYLGQTSHTYPQLNPAVYKLYSDILIIEKPSIGYTAISFNPEIIRKL